MKKIAFLFLTTFPLFVLSQVPITFSDEFYLEESSNYDNWEYQEQIFFALPLSVNDYLPIENYQFNILFNPQIVELNTQIIQDINSSNFTAPYGVDNAVSGQQGQISAEVFSVSSNQSLATISFQHSSPISEIQFDNGYAVLIYLPFTKVDACNKAPLQISFSDGNIDGQFVNPNQTHSFIINESLTEQGGNLFTQDAYVYFNILSAEVVQNGITLESTINGGTPPYTYEWTDKMDAVLSTDSFFIPGQSDDYLLYVYDQNNCSYILYVSYDQTLSIEEHSSFSLFPNPATTDINLSTPHYNHYQLLNNKGQIVNSQYFNMNTIVRRKRLPAGTYYLKLYSETKQIVKKVVFN